MKKKYKIDPKAYIEFMEITHDGMKRLLDMVLCNLNSIKGLAQAIEAYHGKSFKINYPFDPKIIDNLIDEIQKYLKKMETNP